MMRTITPVLSVLIAGLLFFFFTQPRFDELKAVQTQIDAYQKATEGYKAFSGTLESKLSAMRNRSALESERLNLLIPDKIDETRFLVDLEKMAKNNNMLFGNIKVESKDSVLGNGDTGAVSDELRTADISFEVIGTYDQFKELLRDIESSIAILEVVEISFKASDDIFQQFAITVRTYALPK